MNSTMALKPMVFALAAVMAFAVQAAAPDDDQGNGNQPAGPSLDQVLQITAGAGAVVVDEQESNTGSVRNQGTQHDARVRDSAESSNGNLGMNNASGDGNQQDNAAALATADESFIFGSAIAVTSASQTISGNTARNRASAANANMTNVGNNGSGNIGVNNSAGSFNQQKNNLAIAVSGGRVAVAAAAANQSSSGLTANNRAFVAVGATGLAGVTTQQMVTPAGWNPVTNTATLNNVGNNFSGNAGFNNSAGTGNQQSNSLSIAAGCSGC